MRVLHTATDFSTFLLCNLRLNPEPHFAGATLRLKGGTIEIEAKVGKAVINNPQLVTSICAIDEFRLNSAQPSKLTVLDVWTSIGEHFEDIENDFETEMLVVAAFCDWWTNRITALYPHRMTFRLRRGADVIVISEARSEEQECYDISPETSAKLSLLMEEEVEFHARFIYSLISKHKLRVLLDVING